MSTRREFLAAGLLLASSSMASLAQGAKADSATLSIPEMFISDVRFPQGRALVARAVASGIAVAKIEGDLTHLWTGKLQPAWQHRPMTLAGISTRSDLFILETLAADYRMKLLYSEPVPESGEADLYTWWIVPRSRVVHN